MTLPEKNNGERNRFPTSSCTSMATMAVSSHCGLSEDGELGALQILAPFPNLLGKHFTMVIANRHNFMVVKELGP
jgi:hypothetical protein